MTTYPHGFARSLRLIVFAYSYRIEPPLLRVIPTPSQERQSDAVIALVTITGRPESWKAVNSELSHAARSHKPVIALIENGVPCQAPGIHFVNFDRFNPTAHESLFVTALDQIRAEDSTQDFTALAWFSWCRRWIGCSQSIIQ